jgi:uncharacterized protein (UPF0264 family)
MSELCDFVIRSVEQDIEAHTPVLGAMRLCQYVEKSIETTTKEELIILMHLCLVVIGQFYIKRELYSISEYELAMERLTKASIRIQSQTDANVALLVAAESPKRREKKKRPTTHASTRPVGALRTVLDSRIVQWEEEEPV